MKIQNIYIDNKIKIQGSPGKIQGSNYCDAEMQKWIPSNRVLRQIV